MKRFLALGLFGGLLMASVQMGLPKRFWETRDRTGSILPEKRTPYKQETAMQQRPPGEKFGATLGISPAPKSLTSDCKPLSQVETLTMPPVEHPPEGKPSRKGEPLRFAQAIEVRLSPRTSGTWETLNDGTRLWRLRIFSPGALSLNLGFTRYVMPPGGRLFIYSPDYRTVIGPFTEADNEAHGQLWTPLVRGEEIVVEVSLPAAVESQLELELTKVNHAYR